MSDLDQDAPGATQAITSANVSSDGAGNVTTVNDHDYNSAYKQPGSLNLSTVGRRAIVIAIKRGDRPRVIRKTFQVSQSAVQYWRKRA